jgi:hypothetical protein
VRADISKTDMANLTRLYAQLLKLDGRVFTGKMKLDGLTQATAQVLTMDQALDSMARRWDAAAAGTDAAGFAMGRFGGILGILTGKLKLFSGTGLLGLFKTVGVFHLLVDVAFEFLAVLIPATYGLIAFGVAGSDAARAVFTQMKNMHTVMDATGGTIPPFTRNLEALHKAVEPQVFQLFGDALGVINAKTGEFNKLATGTGIVLEQLGARMAIAIEGGGWSDFMKHAVVDVKKLGDVTANTFGIIGNLLKSMPGYAQVILTVFDVASKAVENITGSGAVQGVIKAGLAFHGAFIYAGLGATALQFAMRRGLTTISGWTGKMGIFGFNATKAGVAMSRFSGFAKTAAGLPWGWIAVVAVSLGIIAFKLATAKDETARWIAEMQKAMLLQPAVRGFTALQQNQVLVVMRLHNAQADLTRQMGNLAGTTRVVAGRAGEMNVTLDNSRRAIGELSSAQRQLNMQSQLYTTRLAKLAVGLGGVGAAQGILVASGVTLQQMLDKQPQAFLMIVQQVLATKAAYAAMGQTGGILGADMNALNIAASDQVTAMQKLNSAWDTVIKGISGGQGAFITFEQDMLSVNQSFKQIGGTGRIVTNTFDAVTGKTKTVGVSMNGLSAASLQLRSTWQTAFQGAATLIDGLRTMQSMSPGGFPAVGQAMKLMIDQLVPLGKRSAATRAELVSLAQEVNPNIHNFTELTKWLGNTKGAGKQLNDLVAKMGLNLQDLARDASQLGAAMHTDILNEWAKDRLMGTGFSKDMKALSTDINDNASAAKRHHDADTLYADFRRAGLSAKDAAGLVSTFTGTIFKIPKTWHTKITAEAFANSLLKYKLAIPHEKTATGTLEFHAAGGKIGGTGNRDSVPAMLTPGEVVVPKRMVASGAVDHLRGKLPGFASGGFVGIENSMSKIVPFVSGAESKFMKGAESIFAKAAIDALIAGVKAASQGGTGGLRNPLRHMAGLTPERIDMGVDYGGSGPIYAIGSGKIANTMVPGWPGGAFVNVKLDSKTAYPGKYVYMAEFIAPRVHVGQKVGTNTVIGRATGGGIEGGWAAGSSGNALAAVAGQAAAGGDPGARTTAYGDNFNKLMVALGAPSGIHVGKPVGKVGPGFFHPGAGVGPINSSGYLSRSAAINLGRRMAATYGWTGIQWQDLYKLWQRESTWNSRAQNKSSGAAGIPQDISGNFHGGTYGQLRWGMNYIRNRPGYGSPARAWAHEQAFGWYGQGGKVMDRGGWIGPGATLIQNNTGAPEHLVPTRGGGSDDAVVRELRRQNQLLAEQNDMIARGPAQTGIALGRTLNGVSAARTSGRLHGVRRPVA